MKKIIQIILTFSLFLTAFFAVACGKTGKDSVYFDVHEETVQVEIGKTVSLTVEKHGIDGEATYSTDNPAVVSINENGEIIGLVEGRARVEVSVGEYSDSCTVIVIASGSSSQTAFPHIELSQKDVHLNVGDEFTVTLQLLCDGAICDAEFTCVSSDETVGTASISDNGIVISAIKQGSFEIDVTCTYQGYVLEERINVSVVSEATLALSAQEVEFLLLCNEDGSVIEEEASVEILSATYNGTEYTGDFNVSLAEKEDEDVLKCAIDGKTIRIQAKGHGVAVVNVSFTQGAETFSAAITVNGEVLRGTEVTQGWLQQDGEGKVALEGVSSLEKATIGETDVTELVNIADGNVYMSLGDTASLGLTLGKDYVLNVFSGENAYAVTFKYITKAIASFEDLNSIRNYVWADRPSVNGYYYVIESFDCMGAGFTELNVNLSGFTLDGGYHTISNLYCSSANGNLFRSGYAGSAIKNITFHNFKGAYLIKENQSTIENVLMTYTDNTLESFCGLVMNNGGIIKNCVVDASQLDAYSVADTTCFAKTNSGTVENCIANVSTALGTDTLPVQTETKPLVDCQKYIGYDKDEMLSVLKYRYGADMANMYNWLPVINAIEGISGWLQADGIGSIELAEVATVDKVFIGVTDITSYTSFANGKIAVSLSDTSSLGLSLGGNATVTVYSGDTTYTLSIKYVTKAISTYADLAGLSNYVSNYKLSGYFYLANDIDAEGQSFARLNANLSGGHFDGGNHTISNLYCTSGYIIVGAYGGCTFKNVTFDNFKGQYLMQGNAGTIENVIIRYADQTSFSGLAQTNNATGVIKNCVVEASGSAYVGASVSMLAGTNSGTIENCIANASTAQYESTVLVTTDNGTTTGCTVYNAKTCAEMSEIIKTAYGEDMAAMYVSMYERD